MNDLLRNVKEFVADIIRNNVKDKMNNEFYKSIDIGLINAINCMIDLKIDEKQIKNKIVEYWNLRPSEVYKIITGEKFLICRNKERRFNL